MGTEIPTLHTITAMPLYEKWSTEELRLADWYNG